VEFGEFVSRFADAVEIEEAGSLEAASRLGDLEKWDSLAALSTIAMIFSEYGVQVTARELHDCRTIGDLFETVGRKTRAQQA
jgi:acyl carrier protein